jgi:hypothetical protein
MRQHARRDFALSSVVAQLSLSRRKYLHISPNFNAIDTGAADTDPTPPRPLLHRAAGPRNQMYGDGQQAGHHQLLQPLQITRELGVTFKRKVPEALSMTQCLLRVGGHR